MSFVGMVPFYNQFDLLNPNKSCKYFQGTADTRILVADLDATAMVIQLASFPIEVFL